MGLNWSDEGAVTPVQNRGVCPVSRVFAYIAAAEAQNYLVNGLLVKLSEQQIIDCTPFRHRKCLGEELQEFAVENSYLDAGADYSYRGSKCYCANFYKCQEQEVKCKVRPFHCKQIPSDITVGPLLSVMDLVALVNPSDWDLNPADYLPASNSDPLAVFFILQLLTFFGPVIVGMDRPKDYFNYKSGIYVGCDEIADDDYCGVIVGFDLFNLCWILKESLGSNWGEAGYIRISYGACGIGSKGLWVPNILRGTGN